MKRKVFYAQFFKHGHQVQKYYVARRRWLAWRGYT